MIAMKNILRIACLATAMTAALPLPAQEPGQALSLEEAIAVTLTDNPAMKAAAYEERAAQQQRRAAPQSDCACRRSTLRELTPTWPRTSDSTSTT